MKGLKRWQLKYGQNREGSGKAREVRVESVSFRNHAPRLKHGGPFPTPKLWAYLETCLEGELQLGPLDDDVGEIEKMDFQRIQHSLSRDDDLLRLFFHRQRTNQGGNLQGEGRGVENSRKSESNYFSNQIKGLFSIK